MSKYFQTSIYEEPLASKDKQHELFAGEAEKIVVEKSKGLYKKYFPKQPYPQQLVEEGVHQLFNIVTVGKRIEVVSEDSELDWEGFLSKVFIYYPQIFWYEGYTWEEGNQRTYSFNFVPIFVKTESEGFPFGVNLQKSLTQQDILDDDQVIETWRKELAYLAEDFMVEKQINEEDSAAVTFEDEDKKIEQEPTTSFKTEMADQPLSSDSSLIKMKPIYYVENTSEGYILENRRLKEEKEELLSEIQQLQQQNSKLNTALTEQNPTSTSPSRRSRKRSKGRKLSEVYQKELRKEQEENARVKLSNKKLEQIILQLEKKMMDDKLDILQNKSFLQQSTRGSYKKVTIDLKKYDRYYQKAKYLDFTWQANQELLMATDNYLTIRTPELLYEQERVKKIKKANQEIELFVTRDECRAIAKRVKIKKGFWWFKPRVRMFREDYESLVEKAAYFDVLHAENQFLERFVEAKIEEKDRGNNEILLEVQSTK